jgi:hypothetical protein
VRSVRDWIAGAPTAALAAALAVIVMGAGLFGFAVAELTSDDGGVGGGASATAPQAPAAVGGSTQGGPAGVPSWPGGLAAWSVFIDEAPDRAGAVSAAKDARRAGLDAGVLEAARHGLSRRGRGENARWLVYVGTFAARGGALNLAKRLAVRYPGASVELVQSSQ